MPGGTVIMHGCIGFEMMATLKNFKCLRYHINQAFQPTHMTFLTKSLACEMFISSDLVQSLQVASLTVTTCICKNYRYKLVVLTTEWLPSLHTSWRDNGYENFGMED